MAKTRQAKMWLFCCCVCALLLCAKTLLWVKTRWKTPAKIKREPNRSTQVYRTTDKPGMRHTRPIVQDSKQYNWKPEPWTSQIQPHVNPCTGHYASPAKGIRTHGKQSLRRDVPTHHDHWPTYGKKCHPTKTPWQTTRTSSCPTTKMLTYCCRTTP